MMIWSCKIHVYIIHDEDIMCKNTCVYIIHDDDIMYNVYVYIVHDDDIM